MLGLDRYTSAVIIGQKAVPVKNWSDHLTRFFAQPILDWSDQKFIATYKAEKAGGHI
jgi:hypothetical protein